jgi:hypothetical protein
MHNVTIKRSDEAVMNQSTTIRKANQPFAHNQKKNYIFTLHTGQTLIINVAKQFISWEIVMNTWEIPFRNRLL